MPLYSAMQTFAFLRSLNESNLESACTTIATDDFLSVSPYNAVVKL